MLHELGHFYCGHLNDGKDKWLPTRPYLDVDQIEFEAETVCWIVCERLGIESPSVEGLIVVRNYMPQKDGVTAKVTPFFCFHAWFLKWPARKWRESPRRQES